MVLNLFINGFIEEPHFFCVWYKEQFFLFCSFVETLTVQYKAKWGLISLANSVITEERTRFLFWK